MTWKSGKRIVWAILSLENRIETSYITLCYFIFYSILYEIYTYEILCKIVFWNDMTWDDYSHIYIMNMMTMMLPPKKQYKASAKEYYDGSLYPFFLCYFFLTMGFQWYLDCLMYVHIWKLGKYLYYGVCC